MTTGIRCPVSIFSNAWPDYLINDPDPGKVGHGREYVLLIRLIIFGTHE